MERRIYGPDVRVIFPKEPTSGVADLTDEDCAAADGLMTLRHRVTAKDLERFPKLRAICRMGVGYDSLDCAAAANRQIMILNVPDYGTTEVADHAMSLALALRRGLLIHLEAQRADPSAVWRYIDDPLVRRSSVQTFGIVGMAVSPPRSPCAPRHSVSASCFSTPVCRTVWNWASASIVLRRWRP